MASTTTDAVTAPSHERADVRWGVLAAFVAVVATIVVFSRRSAVAAALMVPYALWVGFAGYLTAYIVLAN